MIATTSLQNSYNKLYVQLRKYIWDFKMVEALAEFEIAVYQRFPDLDNVKRKFNALYSDVRHTDVFDEDEDLRSAFEVFQDKLNDVDTFYADLTTFKEVIPYEHDDKEESKESDSGEFRTEELDIEDESETEPEEE